MLLGSCLRRFSHKVRQKRLVNMNGRNCVTTRRKSVLVYRSTSVDPFVNLAFEDLIHDQVDHANTKILFLWRNEPTVVIGRHQNPWKECNLELIKSKGINLVRRKSGGGTVYHDPGNLNFTFFTDRQGYNRKRNLEFIANFLKYFYRFDVSLNERDDLVLETKYKISGTAAKLGLNKAYHHCTLLCNIDTTVLDSVLRPNYTSIDSNATQSVKSKTKNLFNTSDSFDWEEITKELAKAFVGQYQSRDNSLNSNNCLIDVDPLLIDKSQEILKRRDDFTGWDWNYGKTPEFSFQTQKQFPFDTVSLKLTINKGLISQVDINCNNSMIEIIISNFVEKLLGNRFERSDILATLSYQLSNESFTQSQEDNVRKEIAEWITSFFH